MFFYANAIDGMFNYVSEFLSKVAKWIPKIDIPWEKLTENWEFLNTYIRQANIFFPIDTLLVIAGLIITFLGIMLIIWGIKFLKGFIPFFGG